GFNDDVYDIQIQSNGRIVVAGDFTSFRDTARGRGLFRLNPIGTRDASFGFTGVSDYISSAMVESGGSILIGGAFTNFGPTLSNYFVRITSAGVSDPTFDTTSSQSNGAIQAMARQADGKLIIGGTFTVFKGIAMKRIARLHRDGSVDTSFHAGNAFDNGVVNALAVQPNGKIIVGGTFTSHNGIASPRLVQLDMDGSRDMTFNAGGAGPNSTVNALLLLANGKVMVGGAFTSYNSISCGSLIRLDATGNRDLSFNQGGTGMSGTVNAIVLQTDSFLVAGGGFSSYNGTSALRLIRLSPQGVRDASFLSTSFSSSATEPIQTVSSPLSVLQIGSGVPQKRERLKFQSTRFSSQLPNLPVPVEAGFQLMVLFSSIMRSLKAVVLMNQASNG
ncbi:MAG: hypothetical protein EOP53_03700, partial [Sphingobacteriales bacterium]